CDLAIGLTSGRSGRFPARADLLAPDLHGVAAIIEAGAQRRAAVLDAVGLSLVANVAGAVWGLRGAPGVERASLAVNVTALAALADGATADVALIGAVIVANAAVGAWQERQAGQAAQALERLSAATARVLRDGAMVRLPAAELVPGDVLLLAPGDRIAADARLLEAAGLEVDEAALTGESLSVPKAPTGGADASRVVLEGSDVLVGTGRAVVVAVGPHTRMGATAAALALHETRESPLGRRLSDMLREMLPLIGAGGAAVVA